MRPAAAVRLLRGRDEGLLEELDSCPGLLVLELDTDARSVVVLVPPGWDELPAALAVLAARGLPATVVSRDGRTAGPR